MSYRTEQPRGEEIVNRERIQIGMDGNTLQIYIKDPNDISFYLVEELPLTQDEVYVANNHQSPNIEESSKIAERLSRILKLCGQHHDIENPTFTLPPADKANIVPSSAICQPANHDFTTEKELPTLTLDSDWSEIIDFYLHDFLKTRQPSPWEEIQLLRRWHLKKDQSAKEWLIKGNVRWIMTIAGRFNHGDPNTFLHAVQEGLIALHESIDRFNICSDYRLMTFATLPIKKAISRFADWTRFSTSIPVNALEKLRAALNKIGADMSPEAISQLEEAGYPNEAILLRLIYPFRSPRTLDDPFLKIILQTDNLDGSPAEAVSNLFEEYLTAEEEKVLRSTYGFKPDGERLPRNEIARKLGRTEQRIGQLKNQAHLRLFFGILIECFGDQKFENFISELSQEEREIVHAFLWGNKGRPATLEMLCIRSSVKNQRNEIEKLLRQTVEKIYLQLTPNEQSVLLSFFS